MGKSADLAVPVDLEGGANVIDLEAFRQRKLREEREPSLREPHAMQVFMPVWVYWVPVWTAVVP